MRRVRKAIASLSFPYPDMGDEFAGSRSKGGEGEEIIFNVKKGAGSVYVEVCVDFGKEGHEYDPEYFEIEFDNIAKNIGKNLGCDVYYGEIKYTYCRN